MLVINDWIGRIGNNVLQLIRAIYYAKIKNHNIILIKENPYILCRGIQINDNENVNKETIADSFFSLKKFNIIDPQPYIMKEIFQNIIKPFFKYSNNEIIDKIDNKSELFIHFRGGDIFLPNPHKAYVQPPLSYYKKIITDYNKINLVCEDKLNPCINELLKLENVDYLSKTLEDDIKILSNVENLVIGFGTFGFLLYLMNKNLKNLYIPKYFLDELPKGEWGNVNIHSIELPNYIKIGEWKFNEEQKNKMLSYKI
tara:strand:- start:12123 stop:12890 length:768 start_codon:yes stop_codon:yes gene_type:complete